MSLADYRSALYGIKYLGSMETEDGCITEISDALSIDRFSEGVGGIIYNLEAVFICYTLDFLYIANIAIDMNRNNSYRFRGDELLNLRFINGSVRFLNITEYGIKPVTNNCMGG